MRSSPLLGNQRSTWSRARKTTTGRNADTGAPITTVSNSRVVGWFAWANPDTNQDYHADSVAFILTAPGLLKPADTLSNASYGSFVVLEAGVKRQGEFDRVELRRSGA